MKKFLLIAGLLLPGIARSEQIVQTQYYGENNNSASPVIDATESPDLLNTDISITGNSFKKRKGYGVYKALATAKAMHGGHHFFDSSASDVQVWGSSTSLYGIVGGGTPTQLLSSATLNSTWDCADTQGSAYCVDSSRDAYIKTNGATMSWFTSPLGTMVESTPDRIVVAGVSATPNTIYVSQSNVFTNFVIGINATDPFTEPIASPGSKLTHLRWGCGKVLWWKDQSFGSFDFDDQFNVNIKTVSDTIGTLDNTSAIDPGGNVWFRGQDGHTYRYDCSFLTKETVPITPNIQASGIKTSNSWTQTSQADWQSGSIVPSANLSTTISPGDVTPSSYTVTENSVAQWNLGVSTNIHISTSGFSIGQYNDAGSSVTNVPNYSFETGDLTSWTRTDVGGVTFTTWSVTNAGSGCASFTGIDGSYVLLLTGAGGFSGASTPLYMEVVDMSGNVVASQQIQNPNSYTVCTVYGSQSLTTTSSSAIGKRVKFRLKWCTGGTACSGPYTVATNTNNFIFTGSITLLYGFASASSPEFFDFITGGVNIGTGSITSQAYNTGFTSSTVQLQAGWMAVDTTPYFEIQTSTATLGKWTKLITSTGTNAIANQYVRYLSSITPQGTDSGQVLVTSVTFVARSSGTIYSAVHNAPSFSSWDTLITGTQDNGGSHAFFVRGSTLSYTTLSTTPTWTSVSPGALISASTGTFIQFRDDFSITSATATPILSDGRLNWFEGSPTDQSYMEYFDNAIWESVAFGAGQSTNNYIFKCDLLRYASDRSKSCWTLYNFGAGGFLVQNNTLYFGDTSLGNVFNFGTASSDNGTAINAYRKSKDYSGSDPWLQNQLNQIDTFAKKDQGSTLTATYITDGLITTSYSLNLSTGGTVSESRKILPSGKLGYVFNIQYGDTSASSNWEVFGYRIIYAPQPYRVTQ